MDFTRAYASGTLVKGERVSQTRNPGHQASGQDDSLVRKGLMWVQQDKLFSRWKERFIILTTGYIQIFKKGTSRISDMGSFVSKVSQDRTLWFAQNTKILCPGSLVSSWYNLLRRQTGIPDTNSDNTEGREDPLEEAGRDKGLVQQHSTPFIAREANYQIENYRPVLEKQTSHRFTEYPGLAFGKRPGLLGLQVARPVSVKKAFST